MTATIRENLAILQRQFTTGAIWMRRLGQFVQILLAMSTTGYAYAILPFSRLWRFVKQLIRH